MSAPELMSTMLTFGLIGIFAIAFLEKFAPLVPSYLMLILLGTAGSDSWSPVVIIATTAAGSFTATAAWYAIGRTLGEQRVKTVVVRFGRYVFFTLGTYEFLAAAYRRNNFWVTLIGQTVPVARIFIALPGGVLRLPAAPFMLAAAIGITFYNTIFVTTGVMLQGVHDPIAVGLLVSLLLVLVEGATVCGVRVWRRNRSAAKTPDSRAARG